MHRRTLDFIKLQEAADVATHEQAELILDTNVACELYTVADVLQEVDRYGPFGALSQESFLYRAHRTKHTLLLAWYLSRRRIKAAGLGAEQINMIVGALASEEKPVSFLLTAAYVNIVRELVLMPWQLGALVGVDHYKLYDAADDEILRVAVEDNTPVITWEGYKYDRTFSSDPHKLRNRCIAVGLHTQTPEEYLQSHDFDVPCESRLFLDACENASWDANWNRLTAYQYVDLLLGFYRLILTGEINRSLVSYYDSR